MLLFFIRCALPTIAVTILYILQFVQMNQNVNGIPTTISMRDLSLPRCYALGAKSDPEGLGAKKQVPNCITVGYYPAN